MSLINQIAGLLPDKLLNAKRLGNLTYKTAPGDRPTFVVYPQSGMPTFNVQAHPDGVVGSYAGLVRFTLIRYGVPNLE